MSADLAFTLSDEGYDRIVATHRVELCDNPRMEIAAWLVAWTLAAGMSQPPPACASTPHRAFDFWVGEWDVSGPDGKPAGTSRVERILDGCVIMEHWSTIGAPYSGKSFNTFNPADGQWTQHWVDSTGASIVLSGTFEGTTLVYRRDLVRRDGKPAKARMTFFNLPDGRVRQLVEQSIDGGATWNTQVDYMYTRHR